MKQVARNTCWIVRIIGFVKWPGLARILGIVISREAFLFCCLIELSSIGDMDSSPAIFWRLQPFLVLNHGTRPGLCPGPSLYRPSVP